MKSNESKNLKGNFHADIANEIREIQRMSVRNINEEKETEEGHLLIISPEVPVCKPVDETKTVAKWLFGQRYQQTSIIF